MPPSEACLQGIKDNGLPWQSRGPQIAALGKQIGRLYDRERNGEFDAGDVSLLTQLSNRIGKNIKTWLATVTDATILDDFDYRHADEIEYLADIDVAKEIGIGIYPHVDDVFTEVIVIMNSLYDNFDYYRILLR